MNIFEQLLEENGYEGLIQTIIVAGVDELRMRRFMNIVQDDNGNEIYTKWLMENAEQISEKLGKNHIIQEDAVPLAVIIINEFMAWLDNVQTVLLRGSL